MFQTDAPDIFDRLAKPDNGEKSGKVPAEGQVSSLPLNELLALRQQVNAALPARSLKDINLSNELVVQVLALQQAQQKALEADDTPINQLAQAMNALSAALTTLAKLQNETYTSERLKKVEAILIETLLELPVEAQEKFIVAYSRELGTLD